MRSDSKPIQTMLANHVKIVPGVERWSQKAARVMDAMGVTGAHLQRVDSLSEEMSVIQGYLTLRYVEMGKSDLRCRRVLSYSLRKDDDGCCHCHCLGCSGKKEEC